MHPSVWWILVAVVLFILELTTASFFFLWIGASALLTAAVSFFVDAPWISYAAFAILSIFLVTLSRRWAPGFSGKTHRSANVDGLVGLSAVVTKVEKGRPTEGYVKISGESWKAEALGGKSLELNANVRVVEVRANKVMVEV